ncbi:alpha-L-rhamnosidase-related protein [Paenibacillus kribbensis]|uniref:alpha-L-rhamnosidase-related protein n=1 Tax=Paenibacillus kribbensis TaxID=172713 RepID=UPI0008392DE4|nr:family 78 glycoside hydrolase catalytic domain [Paenibacillus kribbensis]
MSDQSPVQQATKTTILRNEAFINLAVQAQPQLNTSTVHPHQMVEIVRDTDVIHGWKTSPVQCVSTLSQQHYGKGEEFILDFGTHQVGYLSFSVRPVGSPPDAPLHLKLTFGEMPVEVAEPFSNYTGWISSSWLQEETIYVDVLPGVIELPRRYSFRYVKFEIKDTSKKYRVAFDDIRIQAVTSADASHLVPLEHADPLLRDIDQVSIRTLQNCMQEVFEDGPKRDRRLWLGDLRLQALANYETFGNHELVKRCLYLFAGVPNDRGQVAANLFITPSLIPDDTYLFDYSLLLTISLYDYYEATQDSDTLQELWPTAYRQVELALECLNEEHLPPHNDEWWSFIDWHQQLDKQAPSQAILIYTLKRAIPLAKQIDPDKLPFLNRRLDDVTAAALTRLWDEEQGFFVSGPNRQISWAGQIWMALAEVLDTESNAALMQRLLSEQPEIGLTTPYMHHYLVEALLITGDRDAAVKHLKSYWGGMLRDGADTFWELYDPDNKAFSPYGSYLINSYCHAWSCTPTYLIRKYKL